LDPQYCGLPLSYGPITNFSSKNQQRWSLDPQYCGLPLSYGPIIFNLLNIQLPSSVLNNTTIALYSNFVFKNPQLLRFDPLSGLPFKYDSIILPK